MHTKKHLHGIPYYTIYYIIIIYAFEVDKFARMDAFKHTYIRAYMNTCMYTIMSKHTTYNAYTYIHAWDAQMNIHQRT
jgi:hypothetical protein